MLSNHGRNWLTIVKPTMPSTFTTIPLKPKHKHIPNSNANANANPNLNPNPIPNLNHNFNLCDDTATFE